MIELDLAYKEHLYKQNQKRVEEQEKLYYYYIAEHEKMLEYLENALKKTFSDTVIREMQKDYLNITRKIIDETKVVYHEPPQRKVFINDAENEALTEYFNSKLPIRQSSKDKKIQRFAGLFNTAIMEVFYNPFKKTFDYRIENPANYSVIPHEDDDYRIGQLMYKKYFKNEKGEDEHYTVVWTDEEHYKLDVNGNKVPFPDNEEMINPYGIMPFPIMREEEMDGFWGSGQTDIVNANEIINVFLTDLASTTLLTAWGTPLFVNCGLDKKATDDETSDVKELAIGPRHPISIDNVSNDMVPPRIEYISQQPMITELMNEIDWRIIMLARNKGLDANLFLKEVKATSGFSKVMDKVNQIEIRKDDIESCREFEKERFEIIKKINNYYADIGEEGFEQIPEEAELQIDFAEISLPETKDEKWKEREEMEKRNMASPVDWLMDDNPELSKEDAEQILRDNKSLNGIQTTPPNPLEDLFNEEEQEENDNT